VKGARQAVGRWTLWRDAAL